MRNILNISLRIILNALILILLTIIFSLIVYFYNEKKAVETKTFHQPLFSAHLVVTGSMQEKIQINDVVINRYIKPKDVTVGDIITFRYPDKIDVNYTHRVVGIVLEDDHYYYKTKGDNNDVIDNFLVKDENLIGKVMFIVPKLGFVYLFLNSYIGVSALIILLLGAFISYRIFIDIVEIFKKKKTKENIDGI